MADQASPSPSQPSSSTPPEEKVPLLEVLRDLGGTLTQSELPGSAELLHVVGSIVKVMDHAGVEVADELYPPEPTPVQRPETVDAVHRQATNSRLDRLEGALERIIGHLEGSSSSPSSSSSSTSSESGGAQS